jgi:hypothetical protein
MAKELRSSASRNLKIANSELSSRVPIPWETATASMRRRFVGISSATASPDGAGEIFEAMVVALCCEHYWCVTRGFFLL